jgi:hypothetical protein
MVNYGVLDNFRPSFSPDSVLLGVHGHANTVVRRANSGQFVQSSSESPGFRGEFSADSSRLIHVEAPAGQRAVLRPFDIGTGQQVAQTVMSITGSSTAWAGFSADRRLLAIRGERAAIFDVGASEPRFASMAPWQYPVRYQGQPVSHRNRRGGLVR